MRESLGLIGIGLVGTALAENLLVAGFDVVGFTRSTASRDALVRCGGLPTPSARAVGEAAERHYLAEGLVFSERLNLDLEAFLALLKVTLAYSRAVDVKRQKMFQGHFTPQSKISQHHEDLRIILDYAELLGQDLPLARAHDAILARGMAAGERDLDTAAVMRHLPALRQEVRHVQ